MQSIADWCPVLPAAGRPIYLAIADALAADLESGRLGDGDRLPTQRALAGALGVDLTTVTKAYAEARRRGLIEATVGRGSFARAPAGRPGLVVDLTMNLPPQPAAARLAERLADGIAALLRRPDGGALLTYRPSGGDEAERLAGARWVRPQLGEVAPSRVLACAGAQHALAALMSTLLRPGELLLTEATTYPNLRGLANHLGLRLQGLPLDGEGLLPDAVDRACRQGRARLLYCLPTIHNPTTATMSPQRRAALAEVALRHGLRIVEDDAYAALPATPLPALAALAPGLVYYVATLAKTVTPGLRLAFLVAPDEAEADRLAMGLRVTGLMAPPLLAALGAGWIVDGTADAIVAAIRDEAAARQALARRILPAEAISAHPEGYHLWLRLPAGWNQVDLVGEMRGRGVVMAASDAFAVGGTAPAAVRLALGAAADRQRLAASLSIIAETLRGRPQSPAGIV